MRRTEFALFFAIMFAAAATTASADDKSATQEDAFDALQSAAAHSLVPEIYSNPDTYGGIYYDNEAGEFVIEYVTDEQPYPQSAGHFSVRYEKVANSWSTLQRELRETAQQTVAEKLPQNVDIDVISNTLKVTPADEKSVANFTDPVTGGMSCSSRQPAAVFNQYPHVAGLGI